MSQSSSFNKTLVATCGKGGTGKTVFASLMARVLLDSGKGGKLLLIDADPAMGLPLSVGVKVKRTMGQVREEIIRTTRKGSREEKAKLGDSLDYMLMEALHETDRFALLAMGRTETLGCFCPVNDLLRGAIEKLSASFDTIIIDGEAGLEQINRQVVRRLDTLIIVSDATSRGLQTAAQIEKMVHAEKVIQCRRMGIVFNRVQGNEDLLERSAGEIGVEVFGYVPLDDKVTQFDLIGKPIIDLPESPSLAAVREIVSGHVFKERFC